MTKTTTATNNISVGFAILSADDKILLGKASDIGGACWTVFKGGIEEGESLIETAARELKEESGIDILTDDRLNKNISSMPFHEYSTRAGKKVILFLLVDKEGALKDYKFECTSFFKPRSDCDREVPEIIDFRWFTLDEARNVVFPSQIGLIDSLKRRNLSNVDIKEKAQSI
jgi:8-oxo-dGTP pyrophosphatase MutT (NUDIX family)